MNVNIEFSEKKTTEKYKYKRKFIAKKKKQVRNLFMQQ